MEENKTKLVDNNIEKLSDEKLEKVSGGGNLTLHFFDKEEDVIFIFSRFDVVYIKENIFSSSLRCVVDKLVPFYDPQYHCYEDLYEVIDENNLRHRVLRDDIVNMA